MATENTPDFVIDVGTKFALNETALKMYLDKNFENKDAAGKFAQEIRNIISGVNQEIGMGSTDEFRDEISNQIKGAIEGAKNSLAKKSDALAPLNWLKSKLDSGSVAGKLRDSLKGADNV